MQFTVSYTRLFVPDFEACFHFYRDVLGMEIVGGKAEWEYIEFKLGGGAYLAMFPRKEMAAILRAESLPAEAPCQDRAGLAFHVANVDELYIELRNKGVYFLLEPANRPEWGIRTAHFRDPAGTLIEINSPLPAGHV